MSNYAIQKELQTRAMDGDPSLPTLRDLRRMAAEQGVEVHRQGGGWIVSMWCESQLAWLEHPAHYSADGLPERIMLARALTV